MLKHHIHIYTWTDKVSARINRTVHMHMESQSLQMATMKNPGAPFACHDDKTNMCNYTYTDTIMLSTNQPFKYANSTLNLQFFMYSTLVLNMVLVLLSSAISPSTRVSLTTLLIVDMSVAEQR